jgi:hypothetical protein
MRADQIWWGGTEHQRDGTGPDGAPLASVPRHQISFMSLEGTGYEVGAISCVSARLVRRL